MCASHCAVAFSVKLLRIWLLVLLAVLLPVRGAMAVAMVCPPAGKVPAQLVVEHEAGKELEQAAHAHHDEGASDPSHASAPDSCNMCAASCSTPPLTRAFEGLQGPIELSSAAFPTVSSPAPTFQSDGQDRPPRTI